LRDDRVFVADDAGKIVSPLRRQAIRFLAEFIFYLARAQPLLRERTFSELAQSRGRFMKGL